MEDKYRALVETVSQNLPLLDEEKLKQREGAESDPGNYTVCIYLPQVQENPDPDCTRKFEDLASGFVDFRNTATSDSGTPSLSDPSAKNIIWLGNDHRIIAANGAKFPFDQNLNDFTIGLKIKYDRERRRFSVLRDSIGQSCQRTEEQISRVIDAVDIAMNRDLIEHDPNIQHRFFLQDYGLLHLKDISERNIYSEVAPLDMSDHATPSTKEGPYDLVLLPSVTESFVTNPAIQEGLIRKIEGLLPQLSKGGRASIRIPIHITARTEYGVFEEEDRISSWIHDFENSHQKTLCQLVLTRRTHKIAGLPNESWGHLLIVNDAE